MPKFSLEKIVNADRDLVFQIFSNCDNYQKLVPQFFPSIRVRSTRGSVSVAEEHLILGDVELVIMAKHVSQDPLLHDVFVIGGDAKGSHIKQEFIELENATKILVDVDLKFKGKMMLSALFGRHDFKEYYSNILDEFGRISEN